MIIKLRDIGNRGLVRDIVPAALPDGYFTEALNVRFSARGVLRWPRAQAIYTVSDATRIASCLRGNGAQVFWASPTTLNGVEIGVLGSGYLSADWHEEVYGRTMIFNSYTNYPQVMREADALFIDLPNWPASTYTPALRVYKNFFVAVGLQEGATEKRNVVMVSDACYDNAVPPNWDYNDPASFALQATVGAGDGPLVDARVMGDTLVIYAERSATAMQFTGNISFPMQFRELFKFGALNRDCVGVFDRRHFVVGPEHIWIHDGVNVQRPAEGRVERAIYADMADRSQVKVAMNPASYEAMIYFRSVDTHDVAWVWNWNFDTWTRVQLNTTKHIWYGPRQSEFTTWDDLWLDSTKWDDLEKLPWSTLSGSPSQNVLFSIGPTRIRQEFFDYAADEEQPYKTSRLVRAGIDLDTLGEFNSRVLKQARRVYPIMEGDDDKALIRMRVGSSQAPDSAITWKAWQSFRVRDGVKLDTRALGRYLALEVEGPHDNAGGWALTGFDIDVREAGGR
jgi:hypothetical protein